MSSEDAATDLAADDTAAGSDAGNSDAGSSGAGNAGSDGRAGNTAAAPDPDEPRAITDPTVMRALAHPVRTALIELLYVLDTLTATQASELLGESPANCAFHLRTLAKYGFAEEAGGGRGRERPWKAATRDISITTEQPDAQAALAADTLTQLWFDQWVARARQVFRSNAVVPGWERASGWQRSAVFITPEETVELRQQMSALVKKYEKRREDPSLRPPGAMPVEWSVFAAPIPELADLAEKQAREAVSRKKADQETKPETDA